ncbi:MAG: putative sulfate exporter family transporter [Kofleriaceae bacterium]
MSSTSPGTLRALVAAWPALVVAALALLTTPHAPWRALGPLSAALLIGLAVRAIRDRAGASPGPAEQAGLRVLATTVLRAAVVISALRLDWAAIAAAGARPWWIAGATVLGGLASFAVLGRWLGLRGPLVALVAIGTSVCGAAAITAAAPRLGARDEDATVAIAIVSVLGAVVSIGLVLAHAWIGIGGEAYALVSGGGLHEVAHVVAASGAVPATAALALLAKLARVALLPVGLAVVGKVARVEPVPGQRHAAIPGLAVAFFATSLIGSLPGWIPGLPASVLSAWGSIVHGALYAANLALAAAMAAIGLRLAPSALARLDRGILRLAVLGAIAVLGAAALTAAAVGARW